MVRVTVVPAGTYWVRGSLSFFACSLQSTCTVIPWMPVMEKYLISSSLPLPFHFYVASSVPQNLRAPKRKDCHLALNALLEGISCFFNRSAKGRYNFFLQQPS